MFAFSICRLLKVNESASAFARYFQADSASNTARFNLSIRTPPESSTLTCRSPHLHESAQNKAGEGVIPSPGMSSGTKKRLCVFSFSVLFLAFSCRTQQAEESLCFRSQSTP